MKKKEVLLFSDGGADPNPGKGGFGVILRCGRHEKEFSKGYRLTTNNRMELMAIIYGLEQLKYESKVQVFSDSKYITEAINKGWVKKWKRNNWFRTKKKKAINIDLWERLLGLLNQHEVTFIWIKGHDGHLENEKCDSLATSAINSNEFLEDKEYISSLQNLPKMDKVKNERDKYTKYNTAHNPSKKRKIKNEGDKCKECNTAVIKKIPRKKRRNSKQKYYYKYYLFCPKCKRMYMVPEAKVEIKKEDIFA